MWGCDTRGTAKPAWRETLSSPGTYACGASRGCVLAVTAGGSPACGAHAPRPAHAEKAPGGEVDLEPPQDSCHRPCEVRSPCSGIHSATVIQYENPGSRASPRRAQADHASRLDHRLPDLPAPGR